MAVVLEIIDLVVCRKIHGCGCVADDPASKGKWSRNKGIISLLQPVPGSTVLGPFCTTQDGNRSYVEKYQNIILRYTFSLTIRLIGVS